jgi:AraC-like DNA-binding protein
MPIAASRTAPPLVAAVLTPQERSQVDAAVHGYAALVCRESIAEALQVVRERPVDTLLVSVHHCRPDQLPTLHAGLRAFPAMPAVALVSRADPATTELLLRLGASGVRQVVDVTTPAGWRRLRELVGHPATPAVARVQGPVLAALEGVPPDARLFLEALLRLAPRTPTVTQLARQLDVRSGTLLTRFARAGLPSPKNYLASLRLVFAAELLEAPGRTVAEVALRLDYSSPQSFGRHLRTLLGITPSEFRARLPFPAALERFVEQMLVPYRAIWLGFHPLSASGLAAPQRVGRRQRAS